MLAAYAWDPFDRLEAFRSFVQDPEGVADPEPDSRAAYTHDPLDRITVQTESHDGDETAEKTTAFTYLALTANVITEHQTGLDDQPITTKSYRYDASARLVGMTNTPVDPDRGGQQGSFTYSFDVHGSVSTLIDEGGAVHAAYGYSAYGDTNTQLSAGDDNVHDPLNPYRYTAKRIDTGTGSLNMGARRFGPDTGRFLSRDRYQGALADLGLGSDPLTGNRYALAAGNPISYIEVDGHRVTANGDGTAERALTNPTISAGPTATTTSTISPTYYIHQADRGDLSSAGSGASAEGSGSPNPACPGVGLCGLERLPLNAMGDVAGDPGWMSSGFRHRLYKTFDPRALRDSFLEGHASITEDLNYLLDPIHGPGAPEDEEYAIGIFFPAGPGGRSSPGATQPASLADDVLALPRGGASLSQQRLEHIVARHWPTSGTTKVGHFSAGTTARGLRDMIDKAVRRGSSRLNTGDRPGMISEYDFGSQIGTNMGGSATSRLRVVVDPNGNVITAFPY